MRAGELQGAALSLLLLTTMIGLASPVAGAGDDLHVAWATSATAWEAPLVVDGQLAVLVDQDRVRGLDLESGAVAWTVLAGNGSWQGGAVASDLVVLASEGPWPIDDHGHGEPNTTLVALDAHSGERRWSHELGGGLGHLASTPAGVAVLWWDDEAVLEVLGLNGTPRWSVPVGPDASSMAAGGKTVVVEAEGTTTAFDAATGDPRWSAETDHVLGFHVAPARVLAQTYRYDEQDHSARTVLVALDQSDGHTAWSWPHPAAYGPFDVHVAEGRVAVPGADGRVHLLELDTGAEVASMERLSDPWNLAFDGDLVYQTGPDGGLSAWRAGDGTRAWDWHWAGEAVSHVTPVDHRLLVKVGHDTLLLLDPRAPATGGVEVRALHVGPTAVAAGLPVAVAAAVEPLEPGLWEARLGVAVDGVLQHERTVAGTSAPGGPIGLAPLNVTTEGDHVLEVLLDGRPTGVRATLTVQAVDTAPSEDPTEPPEAPSPPLAGQGPAHWTTALPARATALVPMGDRLVVAYDEGAAALDAANGERLWSFEAPPHVAPSVRAAGDQVAVWGGGVLQSLDAETGDPQWGRLLTVTALWAGSSWWYVGHGDHLSALDAGTGATRWSVPVAVDGPMAGAGGHLVMGLEGGDLAGVAAETGRVLWRVPSGEDFFPVSPSMVDGSVVLVANDTLQVLDASTGASRWTLGHHDNAPVVPAPGDGRLYLSDNNGTVAAHSLMDGAERWTFDTERGAAALLALGSDDLLVGAWDGTAWRLDRATGEPLWTNGERLVSHVHHWALTSSRVVASGTALDPRYGGPGEGTRLALTSTVDGAHAWAAPTHGAVRHLAVAGTDRIAFVDGVGNDTRVHGLDASRPPAARIETVQLAPEAPEPGEELWAKVTVGNHGSGTGVFDVGLSGPGAQDQWRTVVVEPGANATIAFEPIWTLHPGQHNLTIRVLGGGEVVNLTHPVRVLSWEEAEDQTPLPVALLPLTVLALALARRR